MQEYVTKEDLRQFRLLMINDIRKILALETPQEGSDASSDWMRSKEIRKIMNISPGTLQNLRIRGKIRFKKVMGSYYYNRIDMLNLFDEEK